MTFDNLFDAVNWGLGPVGIYKHETIGSLWLETLAAKGHVSKCRPGSHQLSGADLALALPLALGLGGSLASRNPSEKEINPE